MVVLSDADLLQGLQLYIMAQVRDIILQMYALVDVNLPMGFCGVLNQKI